MVESRFDGLAKFIATTHSRRQVLRVLGGAMTGLVASVAGREPTGAVICRAGGVLCAKDAQCCSDLCDPDTHHCTCDEETILCRDRCIPACAPLDACHLTGTCDSGHGACTNPPAATGTPCGQGPRCEDGVATGQDTCDGSGTCTTGLTVGCAAYVCGATACLTECGDTQDCVADHYCANSTCVPRQDNGASCTGADQCQSGNCIDSACCLTAGCGTCETCATGTCATVQDGTSCDDRGTCCDGVCCTIDQTCCGGACKQGDGATCSQDGDCCSGFCAGQSCQATCSAEGAACSDNADCCNGVSCVNITAGTGVCCASGTACGPNCCQQDTVCTTASCADDTCIYDTKVNCCTQDSNCPGSPDPCQRPSCDLTANTCTRVPVIDGTSCGGDQVCCGGICCSSGQVCAATGCCTPDSAATTCVGTCGMVTNNCGQSIDCTAHCAGCCNGLVCESGSTDALCGSGGQSCVTCKTDDPVCGGHCTLVARSYLCNYPGNRTECSHNTCTDGMLTLAGACDFAGNCNPGNTVSCTPYQCNDTGTACLATCIEDAECVAGDFCTGAGTCIPLQANGAACSGGNQCQSGNCVNNACCAQAGCGPCERCASGTCKPTCSSTQTCCDGTCKVQQGYDCQHDSDCCGGAICNVPRCPECSASICCLPHNADCSAPNSVCCSLICGASGGGVVCY